MGLDGIGGFGKDYAAEFRKNTQAGMDDIRAKINKLTGNVPVGKPETKELGRDFLNDPYASMGLNITKRPEAGSLDDLTAQVTNQQPLSGNIEQQEVKASIDAIEELPYGEHSKLAMQLDVCNTYLGYGQLVEPGEGQISTKDFMLAMFA